MGTQTFIHVITDPEMKDLFKRIKKKKQDFKEHVQSGKQIKEFDFKA